MVTQLKITIENQVTPCMMKRFRVHALTAGEYVLSFMTLFHSLILPRCSTELFILLVLVNFPELSSVHPLYSDNQLNS
jgi:hypothetical protein